MWKRLSGVKVDNIEETIKVIKDEKNLETLDRGLIIGFGAGDITHQIRGTA